MANPVKIIIQAQVEQAAAALRNFVQNGASQIEILNRGSISAGAALGEGIGKGAFKARMGLMELEHTARSTTDILLMGGNSRMLLAQLPQMLQSATLMGYSLSTILPIVGAIGAAVGAGVLVWKEYSKAEREVEDNAKSMTAAFKELPSLLKKISDMQKAGLIGPGGAAAAVAALTGSDGKKRYIDKNGNLTTEEFSKVQEQVYHSGGTVGYVANETVMERNRVATQEEINRLTMDAATVSGKITDEQIAALKDEKDLREKIHAEALSNNEKEIAAINKKYDDEHDKILKNLQVAGAKVQLNKTDPNTGLPEIDFSQSVLSQKERTAFVSDLKENETARQRELTEAQQKLLNAAGKNAAEEVTQKQKLSDLQKQIHADALMGLDQEIAKIQEKYQKQRDILTIGYEQSDSLKEDLKIQKAFNELAMAEANEIQKAKTAQLEKQLQLKYEIARADAEYNLKAIQSNPFLTGTEKAQQSIPAIQALQAANNADMQAQLGIASNPANSLEDQSRALDKYLALKEKQLELDNQLSAAENQNNFGYQFESVMTQIQSKWTTWAQEMSGAFKNAWDGATNAVSGGLAHLFEYGAQRGQWFREIWNGVIGSMISSATNMVVSWAMSHVIMRGISIGWHALETALGIQRVAQHAAQQTAIVTIEGTGANARIIIRTGEAAHDMTMTGAQVATHAGGETTKTGTTAAGAVMRGVIRTIETIYHGVLTGIKVAIHAAGETAMTGATMIGSVIRHLFVFAELQPYILLTALEAAASVAAIPFIGWALAIPTFAATFAALEGLALFEKGGYTGDDMGLVHPHEFVFSAAAVQNVGLGNLTRWHDEAKQGRTSGGSGAAAMSPSGGGTNVHNAIYMDRQKMVDDLAQSDAHEKFIVDVMRRNIHKFT